MKYQLLLPAIAVFALCINAPVIAEDEDIFPSTEETAKAEELKTVTGTLSVATNDEGEAVSASIADDDNSYTIVMDENGKKLASTMADKKVTVVGVVEKKETEEKDDEGEVVKKYELSLKVKSFTAVAEESTENSESEDE
jgi:hypothetical protein